MEVTLHRLAAVLLTVALLMAAPVVHAEPIFDWGPDQALARLLSWLGVEVRMGAGEAASDPSVPTTPVTGDEGPLDPTTTTSDPDPDGTDGETHPGWDPDG